MSNKKIFLGGTCSGYDWRKEFIPLIKEHINYYNPIVKNWSESDRLKEVKERESSDFILYVITSGINGVYSIAEVIDDSNKRPEKTIFCILENGINFQMLRSLKATAKMVESNHAKIFFSLKDAAEYIIKNT